MDLKLADKAIEAYAEIEDEPTRERLEFFRELWEAEAQLREDFGADARPELPEPELVQEAFAAGKSLLSLVEGAIDEERAAKACERIAACICGSKGFEADSVTWLADVSWASILQAADVKEALSAPGTYLDEVAEALGADGTFSQDQIPLIEWVLMCMVRVFAEKPAAELMKVAGARESDEAATQPLACPACGAPATLAVVGPTSRVDVNGRRLYCDYCGSTWEVERVRCARCGSQDQTKLNYFNLEGDEAHRLYSCQDCGSYIRTVWQPSLEAPLCCEVENVVMARLDAVAAEALHQGE